MIPQTFIYKVVDGCDIRADVYPARGVRGLAPAVIWLHGGALMWGSCTYMTRPEQVELYTRAGYTLIALDYRLAPESKLPAILEDVLDGLYWVRNQGAARCGIDPERVALIGHSAGGYLALMAGVRAEPPAQCIVSFYGCSDLTGDWYTLPSAHHLEQPRVTVSEAQAVIGEKSISVADRKRGAFYLYCRQNGIYPREVAGVDVSHQPGALDPWCPAKRVSAKYPPTLLLHGDSDEDVPCALSQMMAESLKRAGVSHDLRVLKGFGHVFDDQFDHPDVIQAFVGVMSFLDQHLQPTPKSGV